MSDEFNPDAQGQSAGADTAQSSNETPDSGPSEKQFAGFQKRINELTAKRHAAEDRAQEAERRYQELMLQTMQQIAAPRHEAPQAPQVDIDPDLRKALDAYVGPMKQNFEAEIRAAQARAAAAEMRAVMQSVPPQIAKRAQEVWANWQARGLDRTAGVTPEQAVTWAKGEAFDALQTQPAPQQRPQWNPAPPNGAPQSLVPPPSNSSNGAGPALPANYDDMSPEKQLEFLEKRLNGKSF